MELITKIDEQDLNLIVRKLIDLLPGELANSLLADLLERPNFPVQYIHEIYTKGDKACKITICLRDKLPTDIANMCENALDEDIKIHFRNRKIFKKIHLNKSNPIFMRAFSKNKFKLRMEIIITFKKSNKNISG